MNDYLQQLLLSLLFLDLPGWVAWACVCVCRSSKDASEYERDLVARISSDRVARREKDTRQRKQAVDQARVQAEV
jgi:hypothetical protein